MGGTKPKYKTKQREILLDYLESVPGVHITAGDVCGHFKALGIPIGQSTVYRQLEAMVDVGIVSKYIIDANSPACFEYTTGAVHCDAEPCFHCKCESCGRLIHLHCDELAGIRAHLLAHHHFTLNSMRTVFYGLCEDCGGGRGEYARMEADSHLHGCCVSGRRVRRQDS